MQKTALFEEHKELGARMVDFGGWKMPVSYTSVLKEHEAVRNECGLFDVSHMGEIFISGDKARAFLQYLTINDVNRLAPGKGQYTAICNEKGGMIDDLIMYQLTEQDYLICANASNCEKDFAWIKKQADSFGGVTAENRSDDYSQIAIQGPNSQKVVETILADKDKALFSDLPYTGIMPVNVNGQDAYLARTGYTGEWGYEIYTPNAAAVGLWRDLLATGASPIGLGARDTLRLEACYVLYGNEMNEEITPLEAGVGWATKLDVGDFIGREPLAQMKEAGIPRQNRAFQLIDNGIPRTGMAIFKGDEKIGEVTSGSVLPTVGGAGGMALIATGKAAVGDEVEIDVRGKRKLAKIVKKPLYTAKVKG